MKTKLIAIPALAVLVGFASFASVERDDGGALALRAAPQAEALFLGRAFRAISRAVGGAVRSVTRVATDVGRAVTRVATTVTRVVTDTAKGVGKAVTDTAKKVVTVAKAVVQKVVKGVEGVAALAKKGLVAVGEAVKKGLLALTDLLGWVWREFRDKLLGPVASFFKNAIERAKGALQQLVNRALAALQGIFLDKVLRPALDWAFRKLFPAGEGVLAKVRALVERILGRAERLAGQADALAAALEAAAERNLGKLDGALTRFDRALTAWSNITLADLAKELVAWAHEKASDFVRGKTLELLAAAYKLVEAPINAGKTAALSAISSIPVAGGALAGAADVVLTMGLSALRDAGFKFVAGEAGKLAGMAVDYAGTFLVKGAGALDQKLRPIVEPIVRLVKPWVDKALGLVSGVRGKWQALRAKLAQLRGVLGAQAAR